MTVWDPVSKQPLFKTAACRIVRLQAGRAPSAAPTTAASAPATPQAGQHVPPTAGGAPTTSTTLSDTPRYPNDPSVGAADAAPTCTVAGRD